MWTNCACKLIPRSASFQQWEKIAPTQLSGLHCCVPNLSSCTFDSFCIVIKHIGRFCLMACKHGVILSSTRPRTRNHMWTVVVSAVGSSRPSHHWSVLLPPLRTHCEGGNYQCLTFFPSSPCLGPHLTHMPHYLTISSLTIALPCCLNIHHPYIILSLAFTIHHQHQVITLSLFTVSPAPST